VLLTVCISSGDLPGLGLQAPTLAVSTWSNSNNNNNTGNRSGGLELDRQTVRQRLFWSQRSRRLLLWLCRSGSLSLLLSLSPSKRSRQVAADCGAAGGLWRNESCPCRCPPPPPAIAGDAMPRRAAAAFAAASACAGSCSVKGTCCTLCETWQLSSTNFDAAVRRWQGGGHTSCTAAESLLVTIGIL